MTPAPVLAPHGSVIRHYRVAARMSLSDLADALRLPTIYLGEIERGEKALSRDFWQPLAGALPALGQRREHGILFTAEMVRAIHRGKTETRRLSCRYQVGDLLYVKEMWAAFRQTSYEYDEWEQIVSPHNGSWADEFEHHGPMVVAYRADFERSHDTWVRKSRGVVTQIIERWQSPLHMPKRHARIWLEVTGRREERLQDITEEGARAEGFESRAAFTGGWDRIHGPGAWASNPEVYAIEFRRVK